VKIRGCPAAVSENEAHGALAFLAGKRGSRKIDLGRPARKVRRPANARRCEALALDPKSRGRLWGQWLLDVEARLRNFPGTDLVLLAHFGCHGLGSCACAGVLLVLLVAACGRVTSEGDVRSHTDVGGSSGAAGVVGRNSAGQGNAAQSAAGQGGAESSSAGGPDNAGAGGEPSSAGAGGADSDSCGAPASLGILGDYVARDGSQFWLRQSTTALTLVEVPAGVARQSALPSLWTVVRVCSLQQSFVVQTDLARFERVDFEVKESEIAWCMSAASSPDLETALALPRADPGEPSSGCHGGPFVLLQPEQP
jgi:hypothetical protein